MLDCILRCMNIITKYRNLCQGGVHSSFVKPYILVNYRSIITEETFTHYDTLLSYGILCKVKFFKIKVFAFLLFLQY